MTNWKTFFDAMPPGLTLTEITRRLGEPYSTIRSAAFRCNYAFTDGRRYGQQPNRRFVPEDADWSLSNVELSRKYGVSRERIRFLRTELGLPKVGKRGPKPKKDRTNANLRKVRQVHKPACRGPHQTVRNESPARKGRSQD